MTETLVVGGPSMESDAPEMTEKGHRVGYHYAPRVGGASYRVRIARRRLQAVLSLGDEGYIAEAPELESLGYGASPMEALADLQDNVEQYLEVLGEGAELAPRVSGHAEFVHLLDVPRASWFASVRQPIAGDAAELE